MKTAGTALVAGGEAERYGERCVMMPGLVWPHSGDLCDKPAAAHYIVRFFASFFLKKGEIGTKIY